MIDADPPSRVSDEKKADHLKHLETLAQCVKVDASSPLVIRYPSFAGPPPFPVKDILESFSAPRGAPAGVSLRLMHESESYAAPGWALYKTATSKVIPVEEEGFNPSVHTLTPRALRPAGVIVPVRPAPAPAPSPAPAPTPSPAPAPTPVPVVACDCEVKLLAPLRSELAAEKLNSSQFVAKLHHELGSPNVATITQPLLDGIVGRVMQVIRLKRSISALWGVPTFPFMKDAVDALIAKAEARVAEQKKGAGAMAELATLHLELECKTTPAARDAIRELRAAARISSLPPTAVAAPQTAPSTEPETTTPTRLEAPTAPLGLGLGEGKRERADPCSACVTKDAEIQRLRTAIEPRVGSTTTEGMCRCKLEDHLAELEEKAALEAKVKVVQDAQKAADKAAAAEAKKRKKEADALRDKRKKEEEKLREESKKSNERSKEEKRKVMEKAAAALKALNVVVPSELSMPSATEEVKGPNRKRTAASSSDLPLRNVKAKSTGKNPVRAFPQAFRYVFR